MNQNLMILPMVIMALTTLLLYIPMSRARIRAVKSGKAKPSDFRLVGNEPEESKIFINAIRNQYESPILFYAVCLATVVTQNTSSFLIVLAWAFALIKLVHVLIQSTSNRVRHRRPIFMVAFAILILMWVVLALKLIGIG